MHQFVNGVFVFLLWLYIQGERGHDFTSYLKTRIKFFKASFFFKKTNFSQKSKKYESRYILA